MWRVGSEDITKLEEVQSWTSRLTEGYQSPPNGNRQKPQAASIVEAKTEGKLLLASTTQDLRNTRVLAQKQTLEAEDDFRGHLVTGTGNVGHAGCQFSSLDRADICN